MVGRGLGASDLHERKRTASRPPGRKALSVQNLSWGNMVRNTSFSVYAGQITGIFGLIGSGRSETAKIIAGVQKRNFFHGGEIRLDGRPVRYRVPRAGVKDGIVYVTEDRKLEGFFETMSISQNIYASYLAADKNQSMVVRYDAVKALAEEWTAKLKVRAIDINARVIELSGGNQQKVVIADALVQRPKVIIFDEPTRGVDVGAIAEIHQLIESLADAGLAIVVISSYLPEIMSLSDRILVSRLGRIVEEFSPQDASEEIVMYAAVH
jgi:simple sugar transport system ATP-binding protein